MRRLLISTLLFAPAALATPRLPAQVRSDLSLSYTPVCSLCHIRGNTGAGTEITPFATSARKAGFDGSEQTLRSALTAMNASGVDSDGDGVSDIAELIAGTDPNVYGPVPFATQIDPSYGCAGSSADGFALITALALALILRKRRAAAA